ncbi:helicase associated domain-containing protein [Pelagophyceae sp. CCMP2097]|nr:helicase associated domain-containing protein [Pelagophyceae sp. CCMP2097]
MLGLSRRAAAPRRGLSTYLSSGGWDAQYLRLAAYRAAVGNCFVPQRFVAADGGKLGDWVGKQRQARKAGKLVQDRIEKLDKVDFVWDVLEYLWDFSFELLKTYRTQHGHCDVPQRFVTNGTTLGQWVNDQRKVYKLGKLTLERISRLEGVAFFWTVNPGLWDARFDLLTAYRASFGDCLVPKSFLAADGTKLGQWVAAQRRDYAAGELSADRNDRLDEINFVWRARGALRPRPYGAPRAEGIDP